MRRLVILTPFTLALLATGAASSMARDALRVPPATPTGPAQTYIPLAQIRQTRVRDDRTIDFMTGRTTAYRNTLPQACPGLGFEDRFSYTTRISHLCAVDTITVLTSAPTLSTGATCGLGQFQPVTLAHN